MIATNPETGEVWVTMTDGSIEILHDQNVIKFRDCATKKTINVWVASPKEASRLEDALYRLGRYFKRQGRRQARKAAPTGTAEAVMGMTGMIEIKTPGPVDPGAAET